MKFKMNKIKPSLITHPKSIFDSKLFTSSIELLVDFLSSCIVLLVEESSKVSRYDLRSKYWFTKITVHIHKNQPLLALLLWE